LNGGPVYVSIGAVKIRPRRTSMRGHELRLLLLGGIVLAAAGCATGDEWQTWKEHPTHFASGDHMFFSVRNREGTSPRVTREDIGKARDQAWWGKPITVSQEQILER
jgi:hypothetical protein